MDACIISWTEPEMCTVYAFCIVAGIATRSLIVMAFCYNVSVIELINASLVCG